VPLSSVPSRVLFDNFLPCGFFPFDVFPTMGSHLPPRFTTSWVTVPSQRFSRSQGFFPPVACRPYFMPVPPLGFSPSGSFCSRRGFALSSHPTLLWLAFLPATALDVSPSMSFLGFCSFLTLTPFFKQRFVRFAPLQGFFPREPPFSCTNYFIQEMATLLGFPSLGFSLFLSAGFPRTPILSWA
jgi:hypothetical protein